MHSKTTPMPTFTADFSSMALPSDYVGGQVRRYPRTEASTAVTVRIPVLATVA